MVVRRPTPDQGVAAAVESCQSNTKMKRMVMFGLRALSELCTPPRGRYKENSLDAVARHITGSLGEISTNMSGDEEVMELVMKVCWGISQALEDYRDEQALSQFINEGGVAVVSAAVNGAPCEAGAIMSTFQMVESFSSVGVELSAGDIGPGMTKALSATDLTPVAAVKVSSAISTLAHRQGGAAALASQQATTALLDFAISQSASSDPLSIDAVYHALMAAGCVARAGGSDTACVMKTKDLIDKNITRKKILDAGSQALSGMLTLDQLSHCLQTLQSEPSGSSARDNALELLSAMSYVSEFAEAIVSSGSLPLLIQAVNSTLDDLNAGNREEVLMRGLVGTVTLLGRISRNSAYATQVHEAGGLAAIATAFAAVTDHPEAYSSCSSALSQLTSVSDEYATELYSGYGVSKSVLSTLYQNASTLLIQEASLEFLAALCLYESLHSSLIEESAAEIISYSMQYATDNFTVQMFALKALSRLAPSVYTTASIYEYGGFQGIANSLQANVASEELAALAVQVLASLSFVPDCKQVTTDGMVVDAVLYAMLEHSGNAMIAESGREVLFNVATEADAERHVGNLDSALAHAATDNEGALKSLAAAAGLSKIQRLMPTFENANASNLILKHVGRLIENPGSLQGVTVQVSGMKLTLQEKLLRAAMTTVETLAFGTASSLDEVIPNALQAAGGDKAKNIALSGTDTMEVLHKSIAAMAATEKIKTKESLETSISRATASLKKFSDFRSLCDIILEIIHLLVTSQGGAGVKGYVDGGGLRGLLDHLKKSQFSARTQINGWKIISAVLQANPDYAEPLRSNGAVELCQSALRTHQRNKELKGIVGPIIGLLTPAHELDEMAGKFVRLIREALDGTPDPKKLHQAVVMCIDIGACADGAKALARQGAAKELKRAEEALEGVGGDKTEMLSNISHLLSLLASQRVGLMAMSKEGMANTLMNLVQALDAAGDEEGVQHSLDALGRMLQVDRHSAEIALKRNVVKIATNVLTHFPNHVTIVPAAARVLGAIGRSEAGAISLVSTAEVPLLTQQFNADLMQTTKRDTKISTLGGVSNLVHFSNGHLTNMACEQGLVPTLFDILENNTEDGEVIRGAAEALNKLGKGSLVQLRNHWETHKRGGDIRTIATAVSNCIKSHVKDRDTIVNLIEALAAFTQPGDAAALKESGMFDTLRAALAVGESDEAMDAACAQLIDNIGGAAMVNTEMQNLLAALNAGDPKAMNDSMESLNVLLMAHIDDPDLQLEGEEQVWPGLLARLQQARGDGDIKLMRNIMITAQRLAEQGRSNPDGYRGAWYYSQNLLPECADMINDGGTPMSVKRLVAAMMNGLAIVAANGNTHQMVLDQLSIDKLLEMLEVNHNEMDITASIVSLLNNIAMDEAGIEKLKGANRDIVPLLADIMKIHRGRVKICQPALELTAKLAQPAPQGGPQTSLCFTSGEAIVAADRAPGTSGGAQGYLDAAMMEVMAACVKNPEIRPQVIKQGILLKCLRRLENDSEEEPTAGIRKLGGSEDAVPVIIRNHIALVSEVALNSESDVETNLLVVNIVVSQCNMMEAFGASGEAVHVREKGGHAKLLDMLDEFADNPEIINAAINALAALIVGDPHAAEGEMMGTILPKLLGPILAEEVEMAMEFDEDSEIGRLLLFDRDENGLPNIHRVRCILNLLEACTTNAHGHDYLKQPNVRHVIDVCETVAINHEDDELLSRIEALKNAAGSIDMVHEAPNLEGEEMSMEASKLAMDVDPEDPNALTLKQVHDWLVDRLENQLTIDVNDTSEPMLYERFLFVFTKMTDYSELQLTMDDFAGQQSEWGCKSWILWVTYTPDILPTLLEWGVHTLLFNYINNQALEVAESRQKEVVIGTPPSATLAAFGGVRDPGAVTLAALPSVANDCVNNINICLEEKKTRKDDHIIPRIEMVEKIAINRIIFSAPDIVLALLDAWDYYDKKIFSSIALRHIFRAMRRVVCDGHTDTIIEKNVTQRLIQELEKDFDNPLLIDGFFLLGVLSVDNRLKTMIGEQNGIVVALNILSNHMEDPPGEGVVTNSQLALANLVVGHRKNCNMFLKHGGLDLNVRVLSERGEHFDETNAASALLTNACFRREDIKAAYGEPNVGAPAALAYAISCYDGSTDQAALRCLSNMFKAISNMSLYTPNVELFLESGLENAYYNLLVQSSGLPDDVVKTGLFTLSNLTWENKEENMKKFGIIVPPLIEMASQQTREDVSLLGSSLETLAFLCRLEENAVQFAEYGGVSLAVSLIKMHGATSSYVLQQAISCLGIVARNKDTMHFLTESECLQLLVQVVEGGYFKDEDTQQTQFEVSLTTLRVIRRIITLGGPELAATFSQIGGTASIVWYIDFLASTEDPLPLLALEAVRTLVACIAIGQGDVPEQYVSIDDQLDQMETGKKKGGLFGGKKKVEEDNVTPLVRPTTPRGYEVIGMSSDDIGTIVKSLTNLGKNEAFTRNIRFIRCALGLLTYIAAENIPGCETLLFEYKEGLGNIVNKAFEELGGNRELIMLCISIFGNLGYHHPREFARNLGRDSAAFKSVTEIAKKIGQKEKEKIDKERVKKLKDRADEFLLAWKLVNDGDDGTAMRKFASYETDFAVTLWHKDPYPNGVHDLLIKEQLRAGGRFKIVNEEKTRDSFFWRANQTLAFFQWRIEKDKNVESDTPIMEFSAGVPVSKISHVTKGLANDMLRKAAKKQRGLGADVCFVIQGPATEDFPNGFDFGIKCKSKAERDQFLEWLLEWRDACTY